MLGSIYGWGAKTRGSLRWVAASHLELSLNGDWTTLRSRCDGPTRLVGRSPHYSDVRVVVSQADATLGVCPILW